MAVGIHADVFVVVDIERELKSNIYRTVVIL